MKTMSIDEFVKEGYLQEVNRRLLHPMGVSLDLNSNASSIIDARDDIEGLYYDYIEMSEDEQMTMRARFDNIEDVIKKRKHKRKHILGFIIEPISKILKK